MAAHLPDASHDQVNRFLRNSRRPVRQLRALVQPLLPDSPEAFLLVDDSVQDKKHSRFIDLAKRPYSGNTHSMVTGIGLVNLVHSSGQAGDFLPLDYRVYAPEEDQLTKNDHFLALFDQVVAGGKVLVLDAVGRVVRRQQLAAQAAAATLDLTGLPAGVYAVRCGTATARLVVE